MSSKIAILLRVLATVAVLSTVFTLIDLGAAVEALTSADPRLVALALAFVQIQIVASALRWRFTAGRLGQRMSFTRAIAEYYLASLLNQVLPGGVAGDVVRTTRSAVSQDPGATATVAVQAVMLERLSGQIALFAVAAIGLALSPALVGRALPDEATGAVMLVAGTLVALAGLAALAARFAGRRVAAALKSGRDAMRAALVRERAWLWQGLSSLLVVAAYIAAFVACVSAVGCTLGIRAAIVLVPLILLTMLVPISVAGWGVREAAAAALLPLAGVPVDLAVAASLLYGLTSLAGALPGIAVPAFPLLRKRSEMSVPNE